MIIAAKRRSLCFRRNQPPRGHGNPPMGSDDCPPLSNGSTCCRCGGGGGCCCCCDGGCDDMGACPGCCICGTHMSGGGGDSYGTFSNGSTCCRCGSGCPCGTQVISDSPPSAALAAAAPIAPPGWHAVRSAKVLPRSSASCATSALTTRSCASALPAGRTLRISCSVGRLHESCALARSASGERSSPVIARMVGGRGSARSSAASASSSAERPLLEMQTITSSSRTAPRSPCAHSAACTQCARAPTERSDAASLLAAAALLPIAVGRMVPPQR
mmetsp:Transcript_2391/g.5852  ORF Transcript_2391/g.5852 Transcript_2391/m.5852 type:complete len:273 (-) Transcript_2391:112-930(-)